MMTKSRKFFAIGLLAALLVCYTGRAIPAYALADTVEAVAPVFDTQIYQLQDYIDNGGLTDPQLEIFYILTGIYAMSQAGAQSIQLRDTFQYEDGVWNWLKSLGVRTYNSVINLLPDTVRFPITGELVSTVPFKNSSAMFVASMLGMAIEASSFDNLPEFKARVASGSYRLPLNFGLQVGLNNVFGFSGGIYQWQFDSLPFAYNATYNTGYMSDAQYNSYWNSLTGVTQPLVRCNIDGYTDARLYAHSSGSATIIPNFFSRYHNLFINSSTDTLYLADDNGNLLNFAYDRISVMISRRSSSGSLDLNNTWPLIVRQSGVSYLTNVAFDLNEYGTYLNVARAYFNNEFTYATQLFFEDFVNHVYVGTTWGQRNEIFNISDMNFEEPSPTEEQYYVSVPENQNYFIDIHNLVRDLLGNSDLFQIILNHIVDENGVQVHDDQLIRVTTSIYNLLEMNNPVMPVNLNDIAEYTDNSYLDRVKEEAKRGGNALAYLVAFWHNCDAELIYVLFGAGITVLVGAFIGKWGHS